jgi:hypothetical protein
MATVKGWLEEIESRNHLPPWLIVRALSARVWKVSFASEEGRSALTTCQRQTWS